MKHSQDPWLALTDKLSLSRSEREIIKRYELDPAGRSFLPFADILRAHRFVDESIELLMQGIARHSQFTVARVVLARELYFKGALSEAWRTLKESPTDLSDNVLAKKIQFKLAILLGDLHESKAIFHHMLVRQMTDAETKKLGDLLETSGLDAVRPRVLNELTERGVEPILPVADFLGAGDEKDSPKNRNMNWDALSEVIADEKMARWSGFHISSLEEVFNPNEVANLSDGRGDSRDGAELDSMTLADIYSRQGHFGKALGMYRRLLKLSPRNELLRNKVMELSRLERDQRDTDLSVDPAMVDRMESVEIIDRQVKYLNGLLDRIR